MEKAARANELLDMMELRLASMVQSTGLLSYCPRPSDIIIATYPKAGTTLMQNMCYQVAVATGGGPPSEPDGTAFTDISEVVPWLDFGPQFGITEGPTNPRLFKTHACASEFDLDKSKFIYCIRNPLRYPGSMLDFLFEPTTGENVQDQELKKLIFDEFVRRNLLNYPPAHQSGSGDLPPPRSSRYGTWFMHVQGWLSPPRGNVMILFYEQVTADLSAAVKKVAHFMGRTLSDSAAGAIAEKCGLDTMVGDSRFESHRTSRGLGLGHARLQYCQPKERSGFVQFCVEESSMVAFQRILRDSFGVDCYEAFCDLVSTQQFDKQHVY